MQRDFPTKFTASAFLAAAVMLWGGWMLLPWHLGTYFDPSDFAGVRAHLHLWIWMFRLHLFGMVVSVVAFVALASQLTRAEARVLVWPGVVVASAGMIVSAVGAAFYYHHGVWGAIVLEGKSAEQVQAFVDALRVDTEYVTCLVRFGRVFSGLGIVLMGFGLIRGRLLSTWLGYAAIAIGFAAMGLTMLLPDRLSLFLPVFHFQSLWLVLIGCDLFGSGLRGEATSPNESVVS